MIWVEAPQFWAKLQDLIVQCSRFVSDHKFQQLKEGSNCEPFTCKTSYLIYWAIQLNKLGEFEITKCGLTYDKNSWSRLRYLNFQPSFKFQPWDHQSLKLRLKLKYLKQLLYYKVTMPALSFRDLHNHSSNPHLDAGFCHW